MSAFYAFASNSPILTFFLFCIVFETIARIGVAAFGHCDCEDDE